MLIEKQTPALNRGLFLRRDHIEGICRTVILEGVLLSVVCIIILVFVLQIPK